MKRLLHVALYMLITVLVFAQRGQFFSSDHFSSSLISDLCQDKLGAIWIATDYGLNRFDGYHFQAYLHDAADSTSMVANVVTTLLCDNDGLLWVGTNRGLDCYEPDREIFRHCRFPDNVNPRVSSLLQLHDGSILVGTAGYGAFIVSSPIALNVSRNPSATTLSLNRFTRMGDSNYFSRMYEDSKGRIWKSGFDDQMMMLDGDELRTFRSQVGTPRTFFEYRGELMILGMYGLMVFRNGQLVVAPFDMGSLSEKEAIFTDMALGGDSIIYIGTRGQGLYCISDDRLKPVEASAKGINQSTARISSLMADKRGNLWVGCLRKGLLMLPQRPPQFANWSFEDQGISLGTTIRSVCQGDDGVLWCTVQDVGVYGFNDKGRVVARPQAPDAVEFIFRDSKRRYWIGTDNGLYAYNPLTGGSKLEITYDCDMFNDMTSDDAGRLYISTFSRGFCIYDPQTRLLKNHNFSEEDSLKGHLCNNWVMSMTADRQGLIWLATASGVSCYDPSSDSFRSQGWNQQLDGVVCFEVCELHSGQTPDGRPLQGCIAIGTEQGLFLYDRQARQTVRFPGSEQLQNKAVSYIVQANDGDLWCATSMGIWQYQLDNHSFVGHISGNGLYQKEYLYGVGMHTDNDIIYFGHNDGLTVFSPTSVKKSPHAADALHLVSFRVGDQFVKQGTVINGVEVTERAVSQSSYFTLSYLDHTVTLAFSQFNYDDPSNITLEYSINSGEWIRNPAGQNEFTLGHLQPGTYRIAVRAMQGGNYTPEKIIIVTIRAPWYRSLGAYFVYALLLISLMAYIFYTYRRRARQQLDEDKMKFLINATHDIRSPLTLILSPLRKALRISEELKAKDSEAAVAAPAATLHDSLETIERNANRVLNLVNQILDVRKIDKQQMRLHCQRTDMVAFVRGICKMYEYNAKERNIEFAFEPDEEEIEAWIDRSQFDKVISNLLSNAFKYCGEAGIVRVGLTHDQHALRMQVLDNGAGLDADNLRHMFDRFYQGRNARQLQANGTGIGLNLCKMIVDMHHGTIEALNRTDGQQGAMFIVTLPLGNSHLTDDEIEKNDSLQEPQPTLSKNTSPIIQDTQRYRVLVVDDDAELAHYIADQLSNYYQFGTAPDGREGLKELLTHKYDLVVSDVMMPRMDGFTMLRMIKTNMSIAHIPVIMLTSKADVANRLEGLEHGADAFLAKPFDIDELHLTINNLIRGRQRLKGTFTGAQQLAEQVEMPEVKGNDAVLMERIMKTINKNLFDSNFNVEMLTQEVGISRAQLNRKMKEMAGIPASELIRNIRLEQAARLLKEQKINITQVAYTVGFSNLAHFSTIFRKHFGVAPSEYAESGKE